jgi:hypothetical protein
MEKSATNLPKKSARSHRSHTKVAGDSSKKIDEDQENRLETLSDYEPVR